MGLLALKISSFFFLIRVVFLRHIISVDDISIDSSKVKALLEWRKPKITKEVKSILRLIGYYRRFVEEFTKLA